MKYKYALITVITLLLLIPTFTYAIFVDTEKSPNNTFTALTLDTELEPSYTPLNLSIDDPLHSFFSYKIHNVGTTTTSNKLTISNISNQTFADLVNVEVSLNETTIIYNGILSNLNIYDFLDQIPGQYDKVGFIFSMTNENLELTAGQHLSFVFTNHSWLETSSPNVGFFDNEYLTVNISNNTPILRSIFNAEIEPLPIDILNEI